MSNSFVTPWTVACQDPLSMRSHGQEYWNGLTFLSPGDFPDPGIKPTSPALTSGFFTTEPPRKPLCSGILYGKKSAIKLHKKKKKKKKGGNLDIAKRKKLV